MSNESPAKRNFDGFADVKCVIFDWDGTISDSVAHIVNAVHYVADVMRLPELSSSQIRQGIGLSSEQQIKRLYGSEVDIKEFQTLFEEYYYKNASGKKSDVIFPGVERMIFALYHHGFNLAIATGKCRSGLAQSIDGLGWGALFEVTCCAEEYASKPSPEMVTHIQSVMGLGSNEIIVVGDSYLDLEMASNAGVYGVGVLSGACERVELEKFSNLAILDSAAELKDLLIT